ncbi:hypothetical protein KAH37_00605, partial [bacterium]|nr:hypothetical protein [bacterium]
MKRLLLLIASLTLIFTFTSCGDAPEDNNPYGNIDDTVRPDTSTTDKDVAKVDKDSTVGDDSDAATDDDMQNDSDETGDDDLLLDEDETTDEDESPDGGETSDYDYPPEGVVCDSSYSIKTAADIKAIEQCNTITGQLVVAYYPGTNLKGLERLRIIQGEFNIFENPNLVSLEGLENLEVIGPPTDMDLADGSYISDNPSLKSLSALQSL